MTRIFVGVAWPYANGPFHIGHLAGAYLPGEIFARFHRLCGDEVLMVSGSDMHGTPIAVRADQEGTTAEAIATRYDAVHRSCFERLGFSFDVYTNTHTVLHRRTVQELFMTLLEAGLLTRKTEEGAFCAKDHRFLPDRYLRGTCPHCENPDARGDECDRCGRVLEPRQLRHPSCRLCGTPAEFRASEHFFFRLDLLERQVRSFVERSPHWRANVRGVADNFLAQGLRPTPITRDLEWGVPIPLEGYEGKRIYVWFEAVIGYLSASKEWAIRSGDPDAWHRFWDLDQPVRSFYFIGKDNIFHHTILWPAISLGVGRLALAADVPANEWLTVGGGKISKSRPDGVDATLPTLLDQYPPDVIRFYAAAMAPQNHDTEYDPDEFRRLAEDVLSNQYGNLVQRLLVLTRDRYDGATPRSYPAELTQGAFADRLRAAHARITAEYEQVHLKEALDLALEEVRAGNRRFHEAKPWAAEEPDRTRAVSEALWLVRAVALWLSPVIPFSSASVYRMLGFAEPPGNGSWDEALSPPPAGRPLGEIRPLFPKRDPTPPVSAAPPSASPPAGDPPLEIRVAVIREAVPHPSADRLYALRVDVGDPEARSVVAGIRLSYTPEELLGRRVLLLSNLEPRTIRKVLSDGMLLAADVAGKAVLLEPPEGPPAGTPIDGVERGARRITYEEFSARPLAVGRAVEADEDGTAVDLGGRRIRVPGAFDAGTLLIVRLPGSEAGAATVLRFGEFGPARPSVPVEPGGTVR
jgi:methionyl-tRNA synthetase